MAQAAQLAEALDDSIERIGLPSDTRFDLGVLFVHGIGEHARGDTLTEAGDALVAWLHDRVREDKGSVTVLDVALRQPGPDATTAAHAIVEIRPHEHSAQTVRWLLAEGWWAEVFRPATFGQTAAWGLLIGPWVFANQVHGIWARTTIPPTVPPALRIALLPIVGLTAAGATLLAVAAGLVTSVLAIGLTVFALLPIPGVRDLARGVQRAMAAGVGDAYVLTKSPIRFGAMVSQVRSDLRTVRRRSKRAAVVAHSQGSAVAWHALRRELLEPPEEEPPKKDGPDKRPPPPAPLRLFITYGQALAKLSFMLTLTQGGVATGGGGVAAAVGIASVIAAAIAAVLRVWPVAVGLVVLAVVCQFYLLRVALRIARAAQDRLEEEWGDVSTAARRLRWLDLWASADAVPGGPLPLTADRVSSYKIRNVGSPVDHVNYWGSRNQFIPIVAGELGQIGSLRDLNGPGGLHAPRLVVSAMRRHARVMILIAGRPAAVAAGLAGAAVAWQAPAIGVAIMRALSYVPLIGALLPTKEPWIQQVAGVAAAFAIAAVPWGLILAIWSRLVTADDSTYFSGRRRPLWHPPWWLVGILLPGVLAVAAVVFLLSMGRPGLALAYALVVAVAAPLSAVVLSGGGKTLSEADEAETLPTAIASAGRTVALGEGALVLLAIVVPGAVAVFARDLLLPVLVAEVLLAVAVLLVESWRRYRAFGSAFDRRAGRLPPVTLREITDANREAVLALQITPQQEPFVGSVAGALAEAAAYPHANPWYRAVYAGDQPVGFVMLSWNVPPRPPEIIGPWFLWKLLIDKGHQGRGYGTDVVRQVAELVRAEGADELLTSYVEADGGPAGFYRRLGFEPTGELDVNGEVIVRLPLT